MGPLEEKFGDVLENKLGTKKQAYQSQCFVGNHCKVILEQSDKILEALDGFQEQAVYSELFSRLRDIFRNRQDRVFVSWRGGRLVCRVLGVGMVVSGDFSK